MRYRLRRQLKAADEVITGEGKLRRADVDGEDTIGVARIAKSYKVPVYAFAGCLVQMYKRVSTVVYLPDAMRQALPIQRKKSGLLWRKSRRI